MCAPGETPRSNLLSCFARTLGCWIPIYSRDRRKIIVYQCSDRDTSKLHFRAIPMEACGEERQVKLLGALWSPFALRVRIALALKGIDYEFIEDNLQPKSELLLKSNPVHKRIPVLIHNGKTVCESMIIVQYIEEAWGNKAPILIPKDPYDRAIARFWAAFIDDKLVPCLRVVFTGQGEQQQKALEESVANLVVLEEALRTSPCSSGKLYFGGDEIGFVDIALAGVSAFVKALEKITNSGFIDMPLLSAWIDRICEDNRVKEIMLDPAKMQESIAALRLILIT